MPKGTPLTEGEQSRRRREVFSAAVHLFIERGFTETSVREIAGAAGMGTSSLYDYFKSKDEVLLFMMRDWIRGLAVEARAVAAQNRPVLDRLREIMRRNFDFLVSQKRFYLRLSVEVQRLGAASQRQIQVERHAYQDVVRRLIEEGIADGSIRKVDPLVAARILISGMSPAVFTSRPSGTPDQMFDAIMNVFLRGIQA